MLRRVWRTCPESVWTLPNDFLLHPPPTTYSSSSSSSPPSPLCDAILVFRGSHLSNDRVSLSHLIHYFMVTQIMRIHDTFRFTNFRIDRSSTAPPLDSFAISVLLVDDPIERVFFFFFYQLSRLFRLGRHERLFFRETIRLDSRWIELLSSGSFEPFDGNNRKAVTRPPILAPPPPF